MVDNVPLFQPIFGEKWHQLPLVFKNHYAVRPYSRDQIKAQGTITVKFSWLFRVLSPFIHCFGILPPYRANQIPITVFYSCAPDPSAFCFNRIFYYPKREFAFQSKMIPLGKNQIVELTKSRFGWKCAYDYENNKVKLKHQGFIWKFFSWMIPLPISLILGKCHAEENAISETAFNMHMQFIHPLFGVTYEYYGTFEIVEIKVND
ncbi:MAG: DUF4166 domain-containing protein [Gammaproteobacteria bacterium]|nr:DUF4166 domain-containing protein [Gammaproteobacteria bacterium]